MTEFELNNCDKLQPKNYMKLRIVQGLLFLIISTSCYSTTTTILEKNITTKTSTLNTSYSDSTEYAKYVVPKFRTKKQHIKEENLEETIIYLGDIQIDGKIFYVLTSFKRIQAALVKHGHSIIYILDSKKRIVMEYELGLPEELPFKIENNSLYFHYKDLKTNKHKTFLNRIEKKLPELMCVNPDDCY
jgi:hypothetical protein